jgi:hypothetical protein
MPKSSKQRERRVKLLEQVHSLAQVAIFGNATETYRTCGNPGCRCHHGGPKHGPHMYVSFRGDGQTRNTYVPKDAQPAVLEGVAAWKQMQECLRELADMNKQRALESAREGEPS